jgi:hypothetical protein
MHRSGTSALSGLLHTNGIVMGEKENFYIGNDPRDHPVNTDENPKGFYENMRFRTLNDLILSENGYLVHRFSPYIPDNIIVSEQANDIMAQLITEYNDQYPIWGFKDPRTCLTIDLWEIFLNKNNIEFKTIFIHRDKKDIVASMQKRGNLGTLQQFKDLAKMYYRHVKAKTEKFDATIEFTDLMQNTKETAKFLSEKLNHPITDLSFIDNDTSDTTLS